MNYMNMENPEEAAEAQLPATEETTNINDLNLAKDIDKEKLEKIGTTCKEGFDVDLLSRCEWERNLDDWTKLAMQVREAKSHPWPGASNVKYPLLSTAAMQFNARAYPSLIPSDGKVVKGKTIGKDPNGMKVDKADRVATYMSYQFMHEMNGWDEEMDKMMMILPIIGTLFKKTYWDAATKSIRSPLILPKNLVVNNWAKSIDEAERVSEIIEMTKRIYEERVRQGIFIDADLGDPERSPKENGIGVADATTPYEFIEQHTYLDLDDDGYQEPYIVTFERKTGKVVRIVARFEAEDIEEDEDGKVIRIVPTSYYTKFSFVPNPDGSFYDIGFGVLLGPLNESVNTLINQLVDAGTLNNLQSGFIGKGLKIRAGENKLKPGEWIPVPSTGDDLRKQIVPLPAKEPSNILFQLMGSLITSGKELASVAEIFVGKMPGQNTPATTTMASIEQGMKVFTAVYKRIYRALDKEFKKVYRLNGIYLNPNTYTEVLDVAIGPDDFDSKNYDICPGADPTAVSQTEKLLKAQGLMELLPTGALNPVEVISRILQAQEQPNWEQLFSQEVQQSGQIPQQPDPKMLEMQMKGQLEQQKMQMGQEQARFKAEIESRSAEQKMQMEAMAQAQEMRHKESMAVLEQATAEHKQKIFMAAEANKIKADQVKTQQGLVHKQQSHQQKLAHQKEQTKLVQSQKSTSKAGKSTK
jgi:chaperonin GroES